MINPCIGLGHALAATALLWLSPAAHAADMPIKAPYLEPIYQPAPGWAGFYAGVYAGYGWGSSNVTFSGPLAAAFPGAGLPTSLKTSPDGFMAGAQVGYNWQWGYIVFGPEIDFGYSGIRGSASVTVFPNTLSASQKVDWFGTARGRIGYVFLNDWLLYATGGASFGEVAFDSSLNGIPTSGSKQAFGYTFGGGMEYAIFHRWSLKAEYLYYDLGSLSATNAGIGLITTAQFRGHIGRGGVNFRF
jgi:outer membrane immunogenic protein